MSEIRRLTGVSVVYRIVLCVGQADVRAKDVTIKKIFLLAGHSVGKPFIFNSAMLPFPNPTGTLLERALNSNDTQNVSGVPFLRYNYHVTIYYRSNLFLPLHRITLFYLLYN